MSIAAPAPPNTVRRASRRPFFALALAETFSGSGTRLSMIAIPWLVLTTTGSATATGVVSFAEMLPYVFAKALGGPIVDRIGAKRVAVVADSASVLVIGLVPVLNWLNALHLGVLIPIVAVMGVIRGPSDGAKQALVPQVAAASGIALERGTGVMGAIDRLTQTVGAAAGGALVAVIGSAAALGVDALSFVVAAVCVWFGVSVAAAVDQPDSVRSESDRSGGTVAHYIGDLTQGWQFLRKDTVLMGVSIMLAITNLIDQGWSAVMVPVWARGSGMDAAGMGLLFGVFSGAAVIGAIVAAASASRLPRLQVYALSFIIVGLPRYLVLAIDAHLWVILTVCAVAGFAAGFINPILNAIVFERVPQPMLGRVTALSSALSWIGIPFGGLVAGALIVSVGLPMALAAAGGAYFLATLMPLVRRSFRQFDAHEPHA